LPRSGAAIGVCFIETSLDRRQNPRISQRSGVALALQIEFRVIDAARYIRRQDHLELDVGASRFANQTKKSKNCDRNESRSHGGVLPFARPRIGFDSVFAKEARGLNGLLSHITAAIGLDAGSWGSCGAGERGRKSVLRAFPASLRIEPSLRAPRRGNGIPPLVSRLGSESPQCGSGDEVALTHPITLTKHRAVIGDVVERARTSEAICSIPMARG
jgi:hypothetical protein